MSALKDAFKEDPLNLHKSIPLDFQSINEVPESHIWSESDENLIDPVIRNEVPSPIPIIDLMDPNVKKLIGDACQTWGVFQVTNHGVPSSLFEEIKTEARRLFSLPTLEKRKVLRMPGRATGYGCARLTQLYSKGVWHEGFTTIGSCVDDAKVLWPHDYQRFCNVVDDYQTKMKELAYRLLSLFIESLGVMTQEEIDWVASTAFESRGVLQLNSYPCCPNPSRAIGLPPHTDLLLFTILHQSDIDGLQIFHEGEGWIPVPLIKDALVINVGDLLHIFSNGKFHNVLHRAIVNQAEQRISIAYFCGPPTDSIVKPLSMFEHPCFRATTLKELNEMKTKYAHKAASLLRF